MKIVKKFTTFEELKSCKSNKLKYSARLKKHNEFEKVIMEIRAIVEANQSKQ
jgi:hypothetical protein